MHTRMINEFSRELRTFGLRPVLNALADAIERSALVEEYITLDDECKEGIDPEDLRSAAKNLRADMF